MDLIKVDPNIDLFNLLNCLLQSFKAFLKVLSLLDMPIVSKEDFSLKFTPFLFNFPLQQFKVSVKFPEEDIFLPGKHLFESTEVRDRGFYFIALFLDYYFKFLMFSLSLVDDLL